MKMLTVGVGIRLSKSDLDQLTEVSKQRGYRSRNAAIKAAIAQFLKNEESPKAA